MLCWLADKSTRRRGTRGGLRCAHTATGCTPLELPVQSIAPRGQKRGANPAPLSSLPWSSRAYPPSSFCFEACCAHALREKEVQHQAMQTDAAGPKISETAARRRDDECNGPPFLPTAWRRDDECNGPPILPIAWRCDDECNGPPILPTTRMRVLYAMVPPFSPSSAAGHKCMRCEECIPRVRVQPAYAASMARGVNTTYKKPEGLRSPRYPASCLLCWRVDTRLRLLAATFAVRRCGVPLRLRCSRQSPVWRFRACHQLSSFRECHQAAVDFSQYTLQARARGKQEQHTKNPNSIRARSGEEPQLLCFPPHPCRTGTLFANPLC